MSENESKAIEFLKEYIKSEFHYYTEEFNDNLEIAVNLIEKLKKENEEYKLLNANIEKANRIIEGKEEHVPKDKIREKIKAYQNEIECENSYLEQGIICEEEYKDRVKVYNSYIFILNKLLEEE